MLHKISEGLKIADTGKRVVNLHNTLRLLIESDKLTADPLYLKQLAIERNQEKFGAAVESFIKAFQTKQGLEDTGQLDRATAAALNKALQELGAIPPEPPTETFSVSGQVVSRLRPGVGGLRVEIVDKNVGADKVLAKIATNNEGRFSTTFTNAILLPDKLRPDLQARVYAGKELLGTSDICYNASNRETLNVPLLDQKASFLESEYETLLGVIDEHYQGNLRDLQETADKPDITLLSQKTGWDARAVALAALADQFSQKSQEAKIPIPAEFFYALFRAGLPANEEVFHQADRQTLEAVCRTAKDQGVIPQALESKIPTLVNNFLSLSARNMLAAPPLTGVSSLKEMLNTSGLADDTQKTKFVGLLLEHGSDLPKFWQEVDNNFGKDLAQRLQTDGKLGSLTSNNIPLIEALHSKIPNGITDLAQLAPLGLYQAGEWQKLFGPAIQIPPEIPGDNPEEKKTRYAEYLAQQVRLRYPTACVAEMVNKRELNLDVDDTTNKQVSNFLVKHQGTFELGLQPVQQFINRNNLQPEVPKKVEQQLLRLHRLSQIAPSDAAKQGLLKNKIDSAYQVVQQDKETFVKALGAQLGGTENAAQTAAQTYDNSVRVHNAVLNLAVSYLTAKRGITLGAHTLAAPEETFASSGQLLPFPPKPPLANADDIIAYATLEELVGEMDFCDCDHCRSILSPAAYLVDLLYFLNDPKPPTGSENPQAVLFRRRPDIQHLPLTCDNTNTPLPYIDLVNETLEYYVTHGLNLSGYEGHTCDGGVDPDELLANPHFVSDTAYTLLAGQSIENTLPLLPPTPPLPFHLSLETLRRYFDKFDAPLPKVMEALRLNDNLERPGDEASSEYGWRDILLEELKFSRAEYAQFTDTGYPTEGLGLSNFYGYPWGTADNEVVNDLSHAKTFTRRVGISYENLLEILKTRFVNPNSTLIPKLEHLKISFEILKNFKEGQISEAEFDVLLAPGLDLSQYDGDVKQWVRNQQNYDRIMSLITLANPATPQNVCSFEKVMFRYSDPDMINQNIQALEFVRLIRFIRLWKKLGWTIAQTDKAITALYPTGYIPEPFHDELQNLFILDEGFKILLPRLGIIKRVMADLNLQPNTDLLPLLSCFAPLDTHGDDSLYRQMFLSLALQQQDTAFADDGYGNFLNFPANKPHPNLLSHTETLRAAFLLTADEFTQIIASLENNINISLNVANITEIFRRGWLARKLKLSVREFLDLIKFTSINPFDPPDPPRPGIVQFIEFMNRLQAASLKPEQALYLIWNQDLSGKSAPDDSEILGFASSLRADLAAIDSEFSFTADPDGQIARSKMTLVYGHEAADTFFGLLNQHVITDVEYAHNQETLEEKIITAAPGGIAYDNFGKRLSYQSGVMPDDIRDKLLTALPNTYFTEAVNKLYKKTRTFFDSYPELLPLHDDYFASKEPEEKRRSDLLANFLPQLKDRRQRQQSLQSISAATKTDIAFASAVLADVAVLHAVEDKTRPALDDLLAMERPGLSVDLKGTSLPYHSDADANLTYEVNFSEGKLEGYLEVPENGFYNFYIGGDCNLVTLSLGGITKSMKKEDKVWINDRAIELQAGTLYPLIISFTINNEKVTVRWKAGSGLELIPGRYLYSDTLIDRMRQVYIRFLKATALAKALKLAPTEIAFLASRQAYQVDGQGWLNKLEVDNVCHFPPYFLRLPFNALLDFARLKADLGADGQVLTILKDPVPAAENPASLLYTLFRWEFFSLGDLLTHFGYYDFSYLGDLDIFCRVYDAYAWVKKLGVSASALIKATTNEPNATTVRDFQSALRAQYDTGDWLTVLKPINDELRGLRRDALVAYILHQMRSNLASAHIDTADKLFEYFLMDVQMEPCMQTSRIRHALSSVQLFIERCLMNLEAHVSPISISAKRWQWMKRYRVWEANRKVFLYPENWLEPELGDEQSPFFKETMSELLQGDITDDRAAAAMLNYLSKLDEVAKLEPCGMHHVEEGEVDHVIARTAGANRKYYYRKNAGGSWTPWEQVKLEIEDNPVVPVVWNDRLFLFWLKILKQPLLDPTKMAASPGLYFSEQLGSQPIEYTLAQMPLSELKKNALKDAETNTKLTVQAVLCWSEYYNGKWQQMKTSEINQPLPLGDAPPFDRLALQIKTDIIDDKLIISLLDIQGHEEQNKGCFILYNSYGLPNLDPLYKTSFERLLFSEDGTKLSAKFKYYYNISSSENFYIDNITTMRTTESMIFQIIQPDNCDATKITVYKYYDKTEIMSTYVYSPFIVGNNRHVFYVVMSISGFNLFLRRPYFYYKVNTFFHPFVPKLKQILNTGSLSDMLSPDLQGKQEHFFSWYYYWSNVTKAPIKEIDLSIGGPYANYNWELFFHIPLTIAVHLSKNQRFADAQRWFHFIFDPTCNDLTVAPPERFWKFLYFRNKSPNLNNLDDIIILLSSNPDELSETQKDLREDILKGYQAILNNPFQPHRVARTRPLAYQYHVVMKYLDNLIAWGDHLFRQDTVESLNEATQIYLLAANILGPRPQRIPLLGTVRPMTFAELKEKIPEEKDGNYGFHNALVALEGQFPNLLTSTAPSPGETSKTETLFGLGRTLYFCVPRNDKLLGYWDTVADRLFKIRHCMNIEAVVRQLPLFDPPLDPGMLVKAAAAGLNIGALVSGLHQPLSPVRAPLLIQKALELCAEVKGLGAALLSAIEKKEAEKLVLLRQAHEIEIQKLAQEVRFLQWQQAQDATESLLRSRASALERYRYYLRLLGQTPDPNAAPDTFPLDRRELTEENFDEAFDALVKQYEKTIPVQSYPKLRLAAEASPENQSGASGQGRLCLNVNEDAELNTHLPTARDTGLASSVSNTLAAGFTPVPDSKVNFHYWGLGGTMDLKLGTALVEAAKLAGHIFGITAAWERDQAGIASRTASYERRVDDWILQSNLAGRELMQIGRQILTSLIAEQIAHREYLNIKKQIENSEAVRLFLQEKFTNEELYAWMQGEISRLYYEYYRFAFDTARKAEQTMKHELMRPELDTTDYIKFNYWDAGRQGLLSGETLYLDVKRLEMAYHENNQREYELTKHVSLRQLNPLALLNLKVTGTCEVTLPEWVFDLDCPGHYLRRLKNVSLSIPAVTGPYTSVNCTLSLLKSSLRKSHLLADGQYARRGSEDTRFVDYYGTIQSVVTSTGNNDSGMFETNLRDERYLPFEGAGAESTWKLELPAAFRQFDYNTISDVILHLRYTARQGGSQLRGEAVKHLEDIIKDANAGGLALLFNVKHDFPTEFHQLFVSGTTDVNVTITRDYFPYLTQGKNIKILDDQIKLYVVKSNNNEIELPPFEIKRSDAGGDLSDEKKSFELKLWRNQVQKDGQNYLLIGFSNVTP